MGAHPHARMHAAPLSWLASHTASPHQQACPPSTPPLLLQVLCDTNTDFLVVGILGSQGTGKSTLANALCGLDPRPQAPQQQQEQQQLSGQPPAPTCSAQQHAAGQHCTSGIDLRVRGRAATACRPPQLAGIF